MHGGEIFVPKIPSYKVVDIVNAISQNPKLKVIGIRPGEKIHEEMISKSEIINSKIFKDFFIISNNIKANLSKDFVNGYTSNNNNFLTINQLKKIVSKN